MASDTDTTSPARQAGEKLPIDKLREVSEKLPTDRLRGEVQNLLGALGDRAMGSISEKVEGLTERLGEYAEQGGGSGSSLIGAVTGARELAEGKSPGRALLGAGMASAKDKLKNVFTGGGGKGGGGKKLKVTNIVESIDVGVPVRVAYNQWTQFSDFPSFMKKVENVEQPEEVKTNWKAQVFWSHRSWEATIQSQVPDQQIVWRSKGEKGHVDGSVTFHELAPNLTRILLVLEYHPQGLFERTGNLWRAQGRRARLEFKHFRRHVMTNVILNPDEVEGWRGVIEDGKVVKDHETAVREEGEGSQDEDRQSPDGELPEGEQPEDELPEDEQPEDEQPEDELPEDEQPEDELPEDEQPEDEQPEDEQPEDERAEDELPEDEQPEDEQPEDEQPEDDDVPAAEDEDASQERSRRNDQSAEESDEESSAEEPPRPRRTGGRRRAQATTGRRSRS